MQLFSFQLPSSHWRARLALSLLLIAALCAGFAVWLNRPAQAQIAVRNQGYVPFSDAPIFYRSEDLSDPVAKLQKRLDAGETTLEYDDKQGYLKSILSQLRIPVSSQTWSSPRPAFNTRKSRRKLRAPFTSTTMSTSAMCMTAKRLKSSPSIPCRVPSFIFWMSTRSISLSSSALNWTARNATSPRERAMFPESCCAPSTPRRPEPRR